MSWAVFTMSVVLLEVMANEFFLEIFFYRRREERPAGKVLRIVAASLFFRGWVFISGWSLHLKLAGAILFFCVYTVLFFKANWQQGLCFSIFIMSIAFGMEAMALFGCLPLFPEEMQKPAFLPLEFAIKVVVLALAAAARHVWLKENKQRWIPDNIFILLLFTFTLFVINVFCSDQIQSDYRLSRILVPVIMGVFVLNICFFYNFTVVARRENALQEMDRVNRKREMELALYRSKKEWSERQSRINHDYRNQLQVIGRMLETEPAEAVQAYIARLAGGVKKEADFINTNHSAVNAVLNIKYREAQEKGIVLNVKCSDLSGVAVEESDLVVLLGNLLDNAIEACGDGESDGYIQFKMILEERQLFISTKNRSQNSLSMEGGRFLSTKGDSGRHGIGTVNIEAIAVKYGGIFVLKKRGEYVKAAVILPICAR